MSAGGPAIIYRVQDAAGRGPWRPGFSHRWVDPDRDDRPMPAWYQDRSIVRQLSRFPHLPFPFQGCGCASPVQLRTWFTRSEYERLRAFRFHAVRVHVDVVLAESAWQLVFANRKPLWENAVAFDLYPDGLITESPQREASP